jgi:hypothetical protein
LSKHKKSLHLQKTHNPEKKKKKKKKIVHNTTNDQIFSKNHIPCPPTLSPTAQNTKSRYGKDTKLLKPEKMKSKKKQLMELATYSFFVRRKAKVEPHQLC